MATTPLRLYLHDIEGLVGAGQMEEAIAHCRHILQIYPKSIAVYRLLGKAYLENQRYSDAADVFQRVLSAVPDDFVSHVGMSIIREDEGNMDASIWHMERAFETQPYNSAIQDELRRLYGRRDGMEPPKMRLTRGALARLYMKGDLYQQAIGELRAALAEDPQRSDLQTLLARVYYMAGLKVEAVETCSTLLKKLPFCLDANVLLGAILPETERAQDAQNYRQRAISLDPYFSHAPSNAQTADNVPTNAVTLEKLMYSPSKDGGGEGGQPAWATSLGVSFTDQNEGEAIPDWLSASAGAADTSEDGGGTGAVSPFTESEAAGTFPWEPADEEAAPGEAEPAPAESIPDWMKDAGWSSATGEAKEGPMSFDITEEAAVPVEGELAPADIPVWLREAAPPGVLEPTPAAGEEKASEEILPWLQDTPPGPTDTIVNWLSETKSETPATADETQLPTLAEPMEQLEPEEGVLGALGGVTGAVEAEIPDWLKDTTPAETAETPIESAEAGEVPDWLQSSEPSVQADLEKELPDWLSSTEAETPAISTDIPEWLKTEAPAESGLAEEVEGLAGSEEEIPDWLKTLPETPELPSEPVEAAPVEIAPVDDIVPETSLTGLAPLETFPEETTPGETPAPAEEFPAWLKEVEAEIPEEAVETPHLTGVTEWLDTVSTGDLATGPVGITDWLKGVGEGKETAASEPGPSAVDLFPWMREEKAEGTEEASLQETAPAVPAEQLPDWMREIQAGALTPAGIEEAGISAETELPDINLPSAEIEPGEVTPAFDEGIPAGLDLDDQDAALAWLEGLAAKQGVPEDELITRPEAREEIIPPVEAVPAAPAEDMPDWLKEVEAEVPEEIAPVTQVMPEEAAPAVEGGLPAGLDLSDQDAALAWLEGLAAKQGVPEDELITRPEAREEVVPPVEAVPAAPADEVPDWLKEVEAEVPEEIAATVESVPAAPAEDVPDWLREVVAEVPEEIAPPVEAVPAAPAEDVPEWLKEVEAEVPEEIAAIMAAVPAALPEEVPDWLKEVEAEVPEEIAPVTQAMPEEAAPAVAGGLPAGLDLSDQDAALAWLEGLAAKQGVPEEELIIKNEAREEIAVIVEAVPAAPAEEVPDWLREVVAEVPEEIAPVTQVMPEEAAPAVESGLPAGLDLSDQDAALAWLESLAAKQGVPEEELITKPESRAESPSSWVQEEASEQKPPIAEEQGPVVTEAPESAEALVQAETPAAPAEGVPDWLKAAAEEVGAETIAEVAAVSPGLETVPGETPPVEMPAETTEWIKETELPEWLDKTELAKPVEKADADLPGWIAEATSQETDVGWEPPKTPAPEEKKGPDHTRTNLNSASVGELERLPGIGFVVAQGIINYRASNGPFTRLEDLLDVPGIGPGTVEVLKNWITILPVKAEILETGGAPLDPDHIILRQAHNALHQGDIPTAIKQYEQLLSRMVLLNEIILDLQDALYRYPVDISIWQALGDAYMRNNQLQDALDAYTKAEELLR